MDNLQQKIQQHFAQAGIQQKFVEIVSKHLTDEKVQNIFLDIFEQIKNGDFDILDLDQYLVEEVGLDKEKVFKFTDELFENVLIEIYLELQDFYEQKNLVGAGGKRPLPPKEELQEKMQRIQGSKIDLVAEYNRFISSSLWQNILAAQEQLKDSDEKKLKEEFYSAINANNQIKVVGILRLLSAQGNLRKFFEKDERYRDFFGGILERHRGISEKEEFLKDPAQEKYLVEFLRFILEKRLGFAGNNSALLGVGLGALNRQAGQNEYIDMAYGDESKGIFTWKY